MISNKKYRSNSKTKPEVAKEPATVEPAKATKAKTKHKISTLKLCEKVSNEISNEGNNMNQQISHEFFDYYCVSFSVKDFYQKNKNKNNKL